MPVVVLVTAMRSTRVAHIVLLLLLLPALAVVAVVAIALLATHTKSKITGYELRSQFKSLPRFAIQIK